MKPILLLITLILASFISFTEYKHSTQPPAAASSPIASSTYQVVSVIDGDTIIVEKDGEQITVRLLGIDTPEVDPQYNPIECYGREATNATKEKVLTKTVTLETDDSQGLYDQFDRMLAYVFLSDGANLNLYLITEGFAKEYTYNKPYKYHTEFRTAEKDAQFNEKGLWLKGHCPENG
jgi:micrococcal nuclease